jgi:hypothetical protein
MRNFFKITAGIIVAVLLFQNCQKSDFLVITGVVRDSVTNMPIEGANIWADGKLFTSASDGTFSLEDVDPGKVIIWADKRINYYNTTKEVFITDGRVNKIDFLLSPIPEPEIETGAVTNIASSKATASGRLYLKSGTNALQFGFCWSNTTSFPSLTNCSGFSSTLNGTGNITFTKDLTGLNSETIYYIRTYVVTSAGKTLYGNTVAFTTSTLGINEGLIYHFPFNGDKIDISGNGYSLGAEGGNPTYTTDRFGNANSACHFSAGKWWGGRTQALSNFAVSLWFYKSGSWENSEQHLIQIGDDFGGSTFDNVFYIAQGATPKCFYAGIKINGSFGTDYRISVNSYPSLNAWHHILAQRNGSSFFLYIDGIKVNSIVCPSDLLPSTRYTNIGGAWLGVGAVYQQFKGDLDDLRLYSRALSDDEIKYLSKH